MDDGLLSMGSFARILIFLLTPEFAGTYHFTSFHCSCDGVFSFPEAWSQSGRAELLCHEPKKYLGEAMKMQRLYQIVYNIYIYIIYI